MIAIAITAGFVAALAFAVAVIVAGVSRYAPRARALAAELAGAPKRRVFAFTTSEVRFVSAPARVIMLPARRRIAQSDDLLAAA